MAKIKSSNLLMAVLGIAIAVIIKLLLPAANGLTPEGVTFLGIFIAMIVLMSIGKDNTWPCLLCLVSIGLLGLVPTSSIFATTFGNATLVMVLGAMILSGALETTGVADYVAKWFLSRKAVAGRPMVFFTFVILAMICIACFIDATLAVFCFIPLCHSIMENLGASKKSNIYRCFMFIILWVAGYIQLGFPFGKAMAIIMTNYSASYGFSFDLMTACGYLTPATLIIAFLSLLVFAILCKPEKELFQNYDVEAMRQSLAENRITKKGKVTIAAVLFSIITLVIPSISALGSVATYVAKWESIIQFYLPILVLAIITVDGEHIIDIKQSCAKVMWGTIFMIGTLMFFAGNLSSENFGITAWLINILTPISHAVSPVVLVFVTCAIVVVATNFISNFVCLATGITVFCPVFAELYASGLSFIHPVAVVVMVAVAANISFATPACALAPSILFTSGDMDVGESAGINAVMAALAVIVLSVFCVLVSAVGLFG